MSSAKHRCEQEHVMDLSRECVGGGRGRMRGAQKLESVLHVNGYNEQNCPQILLRSPGGAAGPLGTIYGMQEVLAHPSACVEGGWEQLEPAEGMPWWEERWQQLGPLCAGGRRTRATAQTFPGEFPAAMPLDAGLCSPFPPCTSEVLTF